MIWTYSRGLYKNMYLILRFTTRSLYNNDTHFPLSCLHCLRKLSLYLINQPTASSTSCSSLAVVGITADKLTLH